LGCSPAKWPRYCRYLRVALPIPGPSHPALQPILPLQSFRVRHCLSICWCHLFFFSFVTPSWSPCQHPDLLRPSIHPPEDTTYYSLTICKGTKRSSETETTTAVPSFRQFALFVLYNTLRYLPCAILAVLFVRASLHKKQHAC